MTRAYEAVSGRGGAADVRGAAEAGGRRSARGVGRSVGRSAGRRSYRRGALAAVLGVAVTVVAGCEVDRGMGRERAAGGGTEGGARSAPAVRPVSEGTGSAVLVANRRPLPVPAEPVTRTMVSFEDADSVFRAGDYAAAADLFQAYTLRKPENPWGQYMLGLSAWRAGDLARAETALRRTVELDPRHGKGLLNLARVLLEGDRASEALPYVERAVEQEPESGDVWRVLGNVRAELDSVDEAVAAYRKALMLDPEDAWTMNNLGLLMIREGRYEEALPPLARATELRPEATVFQNNLGIALERNGHVAEAAEAFRTALLAEPDYAKARVSLARVEPRIPSVASEPLDLTAVAADFAAEVDLWRTERLGAEGLVPDVTVGLEPVSAGTPEPPAGSPEPPAAPEGVARTDTAGAPPLSPTIVAPKAPAGPSGGSPEHRPADPTGPRG